MKQTNPIVIFTGLAIVAIALLAGLTKDRWQTMLPGKMAAVQNTAAEPAAGDENGKVAVAAQPEVVVKQPEEIAAVPVVPEVQAPAAEAAVPVTESAPVAVAEMTPTFDTVRVEKSGQAVIAGRAAAGSDVTVKHNGVVIGTTVAGQDGSFVIVPENALPAGSGALTIESKTKTSTFSMKSEQSVAIIVAESASKEALVAVVSPNLPTKVLQKPTESAGIVSAVKPVSLDAVDYDESGNLVFSGRSQPGTTARLYVDNAPVGDAKAAQDGSWIFAGTAPIAAGVHSLRVDGLDTSGTVASRVEVPFFREDAQKVASVAPVPEAIPGAVVLIPAPDEVISAPAAATAAPAEAAATPVVEPAPAPVVEVATAAKSPSTPAEIGTAPVVEAVPPAETVVAAVEPGPVPAAIEAKDGRIIIQPGNNLWKISRALYGSGKKYTVIYEANKNLIGNPALIFPGQVFTMPAATE